MKAIIAAPMSGLIAASALAIIGGAASAAMSPVLPGSLGVPQIQALQEQQQFNNAQPVQRAVWTEDEQRFFWEQQQDRGG